jgi:transposase-like protein
MSTLKKVDMLKNRQTIKRFSESVKLKVLSELSEGKYTKRELCRMYNVGPSTITDWIHKYGRKDLLNQRVTVESMEELSRIHLLQKEISQLKGLLIKKDLDNLMISSYLEVAAEELGFKDAEALKKKLDIKR